MPILKLEFLLIPFLKIQDVAASKMGPDVTATTVNPQTPSEKVKTLPKERNSFHQEKNSNLL